LCNRGCICERFGPGRRLTDLIAADGRKVMSNALGLRRHFVKAAMDAPFLARDEEFELAQRWRGSKDQVALHKLASAQPERAG